VLIMPHVRLSAPVAETSTLQSVKRGADDNPTVGLILCMEKDEVVARYSILHESQQMFASKYMLYLPTEDELRKELARERE
jgi:hypothetical protein